MMTKWLPTDRPNTLPPNASHQVGVGAIVVNEQQQVLVVQEANGPLRGQGVWKMPTGLVHAGELDLRAGVCREWGRGLLCEYFEGMMSCRFESAGGPDSRRQCLDTCVACVTHSPAVVLCCALLLFLFLFYPHR
jgi:hypothetical protein